MRGSAFVVTLFLLLASPQDGTAEPIDADAIDAIFAVHDRADGPGCAVAVYRTGEPMLAKVYGLANLEHGVPITPRTAFDVGSISKQFTALAVLMLEAEGALSLDDDVRRFVPELPDDGAPLTLRDLLHHTSGLRGYPALEQLSGRRVETQEQLVELLARQRELNFPPGSRHEYSHSDYELLAVVVERALGEPFGEVLERTVLGPLGMKNSHVLDSRRLPLPRRATAYAPADSGWATLFPTSLLVGGTGLYTTLEDLERWDRNFYDARVGGRKLVDRLLERPQLASGDPIPYAYGLRHEEYRGLPVVHRGGGGGFSTELMRFPTQGLTVATLCNDDGAHPLHLSRAVAEIFLGDDMEGAATAPSVPEAVSPPAGEPERYAGTYRTEGLRWSLLDLAAAEGALWEVFPDHRQRLDRLADGRYHADGSFYLFRQPADEGPLRLEVSWDSGAAAEVERLERIPGDQLWRPDPAALAPYLGLYYSPELDVAWELRDQEGGFVLRRRGAPDRALTPVEPDLFTRMLGTWDRALYVGIELGRNAEGKVTHFTVSTPPGIDAIRDLRFERVVSSVEEESSKRARALHERLVTIDSHSDFPLESCGATDLQVDVPKMRAGGLDAVFEIVFTAQQERTHDNREEARRRALEQFQAIRDGVRRCGDDVELARTPEDLERIVGSGRLAVAIGIENGFPIGEDLALLETYRDLGAAYVGLTHEGHNDLADSANPSDELGDEASEHGGVSELGRRVIAEMNRLGIMVDVSHLSREATRDAIRLSRAPVIASHSSIFSIRPNPRNIDDETLLALAANGGVIQVTPVHTFIKVDPPAVLEAYDALLDEFGLAEGAEAGELPPERRAEWDARLAEQARHSALATVVHFVDHIDYAVGLVGVDHVGIGSDFSGRGGTAGVTGWSDASETANVTAELLRRGYTEEEIRKIWGGNLLRVWREVRRHRGRKGVRGPAS